MVKALAQGGGGGTKLGGAPPKTQFPGPARALTPGHFSCVEGGNGYLAVGEGAGLDRALYDGAGRRAQQRDVG